MHMVGAYQYYVPQFVPPQTENGNKQFWKQKFHATNEKTHHAHMIGLIFFNFSGQGEVNGRDFFIFSLFPMCSHHVPKRFPRVAQYICNSTSDLSHVVCKPKVIYTKKKMLVIVEYYLWIFLMSSSTCSLFFHQPNFA